jgi:hypothetical protein
MAKRDDQISDEDFKDFLERVSILGEFHGTIGGFTVYRMFGKRIIRKNGKPSVPPSQAQITNRKRFAFLQRKSKEFYSIISRTMTSKDRTFLNEFISLNTHNVVVTEEGCHFKEAPILTHPKKLNQLMGDMYQALIDEPRGLKKILPDREVTEHGILVYWEKGCYLIPTVQWENLRKMERLIRKGILDSFKWGMRLLNREKFLRFERMLILYFYRQKPDFARRRGFFAHDLNFRLGVLQIRFQATDYLALTPFLILIFLAFRWNLFRPMSPPY